MTEAINTVTGTDGNDRIKGRFRDSEGDKVTKGNDIISAGAGNDVVKAGKGDDTMIYTSGNDTYVAGKGEDTLDLSKYSSDEVTISKKGKHVIIETPDGTIKLKNQLKNDLHSGKAMERVVFSDTVLSEAKIKMAAIGESASLNGTDGDDLFSNSSVPQAVEVPESAEIVNPGAGNDTIWADNGGNQTYVYTSGRLQLSDNQGNDTLDLSKYNLSELQIDYSYNSLVITTPDGVVSVLHQSGKFVDGGNAEIGIESFIFADQTLTFEEIHEIGRVIHGTDGDDDLIGLKDGVDGQGSIFIGSDGDDYISSYGSDLNDTFIYKSGNDVYDPGNGHDTLDMSDFSLDEVTIMVFGQGEVQITTANGTVSTYASLSSDYATEEFIFADQTFTAAELEAQYSFG
ncbi:hypothetical protein [Thalassobius sp. I31.1]|uniref:hypothetical protein n=1 Tax=Thalassobius sp. I31.1 TaxID=2109912 RepID=UPI0013004C2B|nr:hypothetical protein [Thalassobius sp. I31.1]